MSISAGTVVETFSGTAGTGHTIDLPTYSAGDVVCIVIAGNPDGTGTRGTLVLPSGWSWLHTSQETGAASTGELAGIYKKMTGSEGSTLALTYNNSVMVQSHATPFSDVDPTTQLDAASPAPTISSGTNGSSPSITTVTDNAWVLRSILTDGSANVSAIPSGHTALGTAAANNPPSNGQNTRKAYEIQVTAGSAGTAQWTHSSEEYVAATWALRPAPAGISSVTPDEFDMDDADVDVASAGAAFDVSDNEVFISDAPTLAGSTNEVDISPSINTESTSLINLDLTQLSAAVLDDLQNLGPGDTRYVIVNATGGEYSFPITLHRPQALEMALGAGTPGGTTSRLTGGTGPDGGGRFEETAAQNPSTTLTNVADNGHREDVASLKFKPNARDVTYRLKFVWGSVDSDTVTNITKVEVSTGVSGDLAFTEAMDTVALTGDVLVQGDLAFTEAMDTVALTGDVLVQGDLAFTDTMDTVALTGDVLVQGDLAFTDTMDTVAMSGIVFFGPITGDLAFTEAMDTVALTGDVLVQGDLAFTEAMDTVALTGGVLVQGDLAFTDVMDVFVFFGGAEITGDLAFTEAAMDTVALTGDVLVQGDLAFTEAMDTVAMSGIVFFVPITGDLAFTEAMDTVALTGDVLVQGDLAFTDVMDVFVFFGGAEITGDLAFTDTMDTVAMTGGPLSQGDLAFTDVMDSIAMAGIVFFVPITGDLAFTEAMDTVALTGDVLVQGDLAFTDVMDTVALTGDVLVQGDLAFTDVMDSFQFLQEAPFRLVLFCNLEMKTAVDRDLERVTAFDSGLKVARSIELDLEVMKNG